MRALIFALCLASGLVNPARSAPAPREGDFIAQNYAFASGETLPELKLHYTTLGSLRKDAAGHATNAVLMLHGTTGVGKNFLARLVPKTRNGSYVIVPAGPEAAGHLTLAQGKVWAPYLQKLIESLPQ